MHCHVTPSWHIVTGEPASLLVPAHSPGFMPPNDALRQRLQTTAQVVNSHRVLFYGLASVTAVVAVVVNALKNHSNFYSVAIYLSKSSRSVLVGGTNTPREHD